jgi:hypothetical protein
VADKRKNKSGKTVTGSALTSLALRLMAQDKSLNLDSAKEKAIDQIKAKQAFEKKQQGLRDVLEYGAGGKFKRKVLSKLLGENIGHKVSDLIRNKDTEANAAQQYADNERQRTAKPPKPIEPPKKVENKTSKEFEIILKRLSTIEANVQAIKAVKVEPPKKEEPILKSPHHEDAKAALKGLGYKKHEIDTMLKGATGSTAAELIKSALKIPKKSEKIPTKDVPAVVEATRADVEKTPPHVVNVVRNEPRPSPVTPVPLEAPPKIEPVANTQTEAVAVKKEVMQEKDTEEDRKQKKSILQELDEIKDKINQSGEGFMGLLSKFFAPIAAFISTGVAALTALAPILGGLAAIAVAAYAGYKIGQWLEDKFHVSEKLVDKFGPQYDNNKVLPSAGKDALNKKLEGTGFTSLGAGKFRDNSGNIVKHDALPPAIKSKLDSGVSTVPTPGAAKATNSQPSPAPVAVIAKDTATSMASKKVDSASTENAQMKQKPASAPIIHQSIDNRKTVTQGGSSSAKPSIVISTRNLEPSVGNYIGSIFNHPVVRFPM